MKGKSIILMLIVLIILVTASLLFYKNALRPAVHRSITTMGEVMVVGLEGFEEGLNFTMPQYEFNCSNETIMPTCLNSGNTSVIIFKSEQMCNASLIMCDGGSKCIIDNKTGLADCQIWGEWDEGYDLNTTLDECVNGTICPDRCDALGNFRQNGECYEQYNKCVYHLVYTHKDYPEYCPPDTNNTPDTPHNESQGNGGNGGGGSPIVFKTLPMSAQGITGAVVFGTGVVNAKNSTIVIFAMVVIIGLTVVYFKMPKRKRRK